MDEEKIYTIGIKKADGTVELLNNSLGPNSLIRIPVYSGDKIDPNKAYESLTGLDEEERQRKGIDCVLVDMTNISQFIEEDSLQLRRL